MTPLLYRRLSDRQRVLIAYFYNQRFGDRTAAKPDDTLPVTRRLYREGWIERSGGSAPVLTNAGAEAYRAALATLCTHPGCTAERWSSYPRCQAHQRDYWSAAAAKSKPSWKSVPPLIPREQPVRVLALDWQNLKLVWVEGRVVSEECMPKTERELLSRLAEAGRDGVLVAKPQVWKAEDLQEDM